MFPHLNNSFVFTFIVKIIVIDYFSIYFQEVYSCENLDK